jgi:hypothetical protein
MVQGQGWRPAVALEFMPLEEPVPEPMLDAVLPELGELVLLPELGDEEALLLDGELMLVLGELEELLPGEPAAEPVVVLELPDPDMPLGEPEPELAAVLSLGWLVARSRQCVDGDTLALGELDDDDDGEELEGDELDDCAAAITTLPPTNTVASNKVCRERIWEPPRRKPHPCAAPYKCPSRTQVTYFFVDAGTLSAEAVRLALIALRKFCADCRAVLPHDRAGGARDCARTKHRKICRGADVMNRTPARPVNRCASEEALVVVHVESRIRKRLVRHGARRAQELHADKAVILPDHLALARDARRIRQHHREFVGHLAWLGDLETRTRRRQVDDPGRPVGGTRADEIHRMVFGAAPILALLAVHSTNLPCRPCVSDNHRRDFGQSLPGW